MKKLNKEVFNDWVYYTIDDYTNRIEVYYGGAGSGKSFGAMQKILLKALNSVRRVLIIRKVGNSLKESSFQLMKSLIFDCGLGDFSKINKSDLTITLCNGSTFIFKGLDDPEKIKSIADITDIVIEEGTELTLDDFTQLNLRLRPKEENPQIYIMFNPVSKTNWVYDYFFSGEKPKNCKIIQTTYKDNKFLNEEYKKELEELQYRNPAYYRIYALGEFATLDKLIFPNYEKRIISSEETKNLIHFCGLDFGYINDPSAIVWRFYDKNNHVIYITGEYVKKGLMNDEIANIIFSLSLQKEEIFADSSEKKSIAEIQRLGINIKSAIKGPDSIIHGIQWMLQNKIIIDERCFKTIEEFENYTWMKDKKTGEYVNKPVDCYNHCIDAIRYGLERYSRGWKKMKIIDRPQGF